MTKNWVQKEYDRSFSSLPAEFDVIDLYFVCSDLKDQYPVDHEPEARTICDAAARNFASSPVMHNRQAPIGKGSETE